MDSYPSATDDLLWLTGTYAPLFVDANFNMIRDALEAVVDYDADGIPTVYRVDNFSPTGSGVGTAYIDITGGAFAGNIQQGTWQSIPVPGYTYDIRLTANLMPTTVGGWQAESFDPAQLTCVPEPGMMILLGSLATGLFGAAGLRRRYAHR
jgi:hypothetical protein